jgi:hypothetical protein
MKQLFFIFLFLVLSSFSLKDKLATASEGDFVITHQNKAFTLLLVRQKTDKRLLLEEISIPQELRKKQKNSWREWVAQKATGHSSWLALDLDLETNRIWQCYSFDEESFMEIRPEESLLSTLLSLKLQPLPQEKRKRIGPPPLQGEVDRRSLWIPPLIVEGHEIAEKEFEVFETTWPQDQTELSSKRMELYFDKASLSPFPFWMEVDTGHLTLILRGIDMGKNMSSPQKLLPLPLPRFVDKEKLEKKELHLFAEAPSSYQNFLLFAFDAVAKKELLPLPFHVQKENNLLTFSISLKELEKTLQKEHLYYWVLMPEKNQQDAICSRLPYLWSSAKEKNKN